MAAQLYSAVQVREHCGKPPHDERAFRSPPPRARFRLPIHYFGFFMLPSRMGAHCEVGAFPAFFFASRI